MKAIFALSIFLTSYAGRIVLSVPSCTTFAARYLKAAPENGVPSWQPSVG